MTKIDITEKINSQLGFSMKESSDLLESVLSIIKSTLEEGQALKITGFGSFEVKQKHDRRGRNPQTGESITIEGRKVLRFKPSALLRHAVNK